MTGLEAAMALQRIRVRVADRYGLTVAGMRAAVVGREDAERRGFAKIVTVHELRGGRDCPGC